MSEAAETNAPAAPRRQRNAAVTRDRILQAAIAEFADRGFSGARMDAIAQRSGANMRMLYHYYGSKDELYVVALETVYADIREREQALNMTHLPPFEAMMKLFDFTFAYFAQHPETVALWSGENLLKAQYLSQSMRAADLSSPLLTAIRETLERGAESGEFRVGIDALQLYVSMVALSYFHLSNGHTLGAIFRTNLQTARWRAERRRHTREMLAAYLAPTTA